MFIFIRQYVLKRRLNSLQVLQEPSFYVTGHLVQPSTMLIIIFRINFLIIIMLVAIESLINLKQYTDLFMITHGLLMGLHLLSIVSCQTEFHSNRKYCYVEFGKIFRCFHTFHALASLHIIVSLCIIVLLLFCFHCRSF